MVDGLIGDRRSLAAMWVAPVVRREGVGRRLALDVLHRHDGPWAVAFQHDNRVAAEFWRRIADEAFGAGAWREEEEPVPGRPGAPPDHWIRTA
jgi:predicted acetyltransferase